VPITLTLGSGTTEVEYPIQDTDASGFFTVSVAGLSNGVYSWRAKGPRWLATSGTVSMSGAATTQQDMGMMMAGDCNNDNAVSVSDFTILKSTFGKGLGDPGYDPRADFTGDDTVTSLDFALLKGHFGQGGALPIGPDPGPGPTGATQN